MKTLLTKIVAIHNVHNQLIALDTENLVDGQIYKSRINQVFSENVNIHAYLPHYLVQIRNFLVDKQEKLPSELLSKILDVFTENVLDLIKDKELTENIKTLIIKKIPEISETLIKMYSKNIAEILLNRDQTNSFQSYKKVSQALKKALINDKDPSGITFSPRSIKLFIWVRQAIADTTNPRIRVLQASSDPSIDKLELNKNLNRLFDIANLLVLQIACGDDIADSIQDEKLTSIFAKIPFSNTQEIEEYRHAVQGYRGSIFLGYFDVAVSIWNEAVDQLKELFGEEYYKNHVEEDFLKVHKTVMGSLTYSQFLNSKPHDPSITQESISEYLDPNIMVECVRTLEEALAIQLCKKLEISEPSLTDQKIIRAIVKKSQQSASYSNAAATAPREQKENDISSPIPFALNSQYSQKLKENNLCLKDEFETFIASKGYQNHFFSSYEEGMPQDKRFDYIDLLFIRREAHTQMLEQLTRLSRRGFKIPESDFCVHTLATESIKYAQSSDDENVRKGQFLIRLKMHIDLIDKFTDHLLVETHVQDQFFIKWENEISSMREEAQEISDPALREQTINYVDSWQLFLCMYLIFKRAFDGTV